MRRKLTRCKLGRIKHVKDRVKTRFDMELSDEDLQQLISQIRRGEATLITRYSHTKILYEVELRGQKMHAVYSSPHRVLLTVLPKQFSIRLQRRNIDGPLNANQLRKAKADIQAFRAKQLERIDFRFSKWEVFFLGYSREVIYDRIDKKVLDPDNLPEFDIKEFVQA